MAFNLHHMATACAKDTPSHFQWCGISDNDHPPPPPGRRPPRAIFFYDMILRARQESRGVVPNAISQLPGFFSAFEDARSRKHRDLTPATASICSNHVPHRCSSLASSCHWTQPLPTICTSSFLSCETHLPHLDCVSIVKSNIYDVHSAFPICSISLHCKSKKSLGVPDEKCSRDCTLASSAMARAVCFRLNISKVAGSGPRNWMPASWIAVANSIFSDKNPYLH